MYCKKRKCVLIFKRTWIIIIADFPKKRFFLNIYVLVNQLVFHQKRNAMKRYFYILFLFLPVYIVIAREYKLIQCNHIADNSKDCRKIGNCLSGMELSNDTLKVTVYIDNQDPDLNMYSDSFTIDHDTLCLNLNDTNALGYSYVFNKVKNKTDTFEIRTVHYQYRTDDRYNTRRMDYTFTGFSMIPKGIKFNRTNICDCPTLPLKFDILLNDTINMINANGLKQGAWIRFFDTGEIEEKKFFDKGKFTGGQLFDKKGNDLHVSYKSENMTISDVRE